MEKNFAFRNRKKLVKKFCNRKKIALKSKEKKVWVKNLVGKKNLIYKKKPTSPADAAGPRHRLPVGGPPHNLGRRIRRRESKQRPGSAGSSAAAAGECAAAQGRRDLASAEGARGGRGRRIQRRRRWGSPRRPREEGERGSREGRERGSGGGRGATASAAGEVRAAPGRKGSGLRGRGGSAAPGRKGGGGIGGEGRERSSAGEEEGTGKGAGKREEKNRPRVGEITVDLKISILAFNSSRCLTSATTILRVPYHPTWETLVNSITWILAATISEVSYLKKPLQHVLIVDLCHPCVNFKAQRTRMTSFF